MALNPFLGMNIATPGMGFGQNPMQSQLMQLMSGLMQKQGGRQMMGKPMPMRSFGANQTNPMMGALGDLQGALGAGVDLPPPDMMTPDMMQKQRFQALNMGGNGNPMFNMLRMMGTSTGQGMSERNPYGTI